MLIKKVYLSSNATADAATCSTHAAFLLANEKTKSTKLDKILMCNYFNI